MSVERRLALLVAVAVLAVNSAWVSAHLGFVHKPKRVGEVDHNHYIAMARGEAGDPALRRTPPYCFRKAVPAAASLLARAGLSVNAAFYLITNLSLLGFLLVIDRLLADLGFRLPTRLVGLVLVGLTQGPIRWFEYQYWMSDPPSFFLLALALLLVRREQLVAAAVVSLASAFIRENHVLLYPCCFLLQWRRHGRAAAAARTAAIAVLPVAVLVGLRLTVPHDPDPGLVSALTDSLGFRWRHLGDNQLYVLTFGTWGVLLALALSSIDRLRRALRDHPDLAALVVMTYGTLVISNNTERPLAYAVPAVLAAALYGLDRLVQEARLPFPLVAAVTVGLQLYLFVETRFLEMGMSLYQPPNVGVAVVMAAASILGAVLLRRRRSAALPAGRVA